MTEIEYSRAADASELCKSCGLCCTGHLFSWVRLKATELTPSEKLGLNVIRNDPKQRGFTQPCPLWNGQCTIYSSPNYPHGCDSYKCKLLRELLDENIELSDALDIVQHAKDAFQNMEAMLPSSSHSSFRERFIAQMKNLKDVLDLEDNFDIKRLAESLMDMIEGSFGVTDFFDKPAD